MKRKKTIYDSVVAKRCGCFAAGLGQIVPKTTQCIRPTKYLKIYYRVSKKMSFAKLSIWRSCCQLRRYTYDILCKYTDAQFGKTRFFETPCIYNDNPLQIIMNENLLRTSRPVSPGPRYCQKKRIPQPWPPT